MNPSDTQPPAIPLLSRQGKIIVIIAGLWCLVGTIFYSHRNGLMQLLTMPVALAFLCSGVMSFVYLFKEWRQRSWRAGVPLVACVLAVIIGGAATARIRHVIFQKTFPSYEAIVRDMEAGKIPVATNSWRIPEAETRARLAEYVFARRTTNGTLVVEFMVESGFPVKHSGYLYCPKVGESGLNTDALVPIGAENPPKWFYFSY